MESSYHHGALRETLLAEGRRVLVEDGVDAVTLRELARRAGVSHAAPRRHFADRHALLEAMAARGFDELTEALRVAGAAGDPSARLASYARSAVRFARENGPLLTLMWTARGDGTGPAAQAAHRFLTAGTTLLGEDPATVSPLPFLVAATLEGIGALAAAGRIPDDRIDEVVDAAVAMLSPALPAHPPAPGPTRGRPAT
ncbi:TetR/AcrR family transcriptional regulator [Actinomycetospora chiangmaiensis]|uniref:TetR/AcrR family transcriptional regulator n=1 Tax=Actinomycetospora chiangmaiensis TaxID=402650 RepID=UPI00037012B6|nr:TetR/AcrR family transcriptional regulator [Actinomycetospora chiangmaiensis]